VLKSHDVLKRAVENVGAKQVAHDLGVSSSLVYKWCAQPASELGEDGSGARNPLDRLLSLVESTGDRSAVEWLCTQVGGCFVENLDPESTSIDAEYIHETQNLLKEFSDLMRVVAESVIDDGRVDSEEASAMRAQLQRLQSRAEAFVRACEQGLFDQRKDEQ
jgi:hypothetical protein